MNRRKAKQGNTLTRQGWHAPTNTCVVDRPLAWPTIHYPTLTPGILLGTITLITELCERSPAALRHFRKVG